MLREELPGPEPLLLLLQYAHEHIIVSAIGQQVVLHDIVLKCIENPGSSRIAERCNLPHHGHVDGQLVLYAAESLQVQHLEFCESKYQSWEFLQYRNWLK